MKRKLAVIVMADLAGYSSLMEKDPQAAISQVRSLRETSLEPLVEAAGGVVEKRMGDGWLLTFGSATQAVSAAQEIQKGLANKAGLKLRLAAHIGEVVEDDGELYGAGINIAARMQAQAPPGGLMVSEECQKQLDPSAANGFADAGTYEFKNLNTPLSCFQWRPEQTRVSGSDDLPVIAIAPFAASPQSAEVAEVADDLQDQLLHRLSLRTGLRVLAADASAESQNGATYLLRGRLRAHGGNARVILSMIQVDTGQVFWSETYEGPDQDLFGFADDVVEQADNALRVQINAFDGKRLAGHSEDALTPSELRTRAAQLFYTGKVSAYRTAERLLSRALELDPGNPMSLGMLCHAVYWPALATFTPLEEAEVKRIVEAADLAIRGAPGSDFAFFTRAEVRCLIQDDLQGAMQDVNRALQINPGYVLAIETLGKIQLLQGQNQAAAKSFQEAVDRSASDPSLPRRTFLLVLAETLGGNLDEASAKMKDLLDLLPNEPAYWRMYQYIQKKLGDQKGADLAGQKAAEFTSEPSILLIELKLPGEHRWLTETLAKGGVSPESRLLH